MDLAFGDGGGSGSNQEEPLEKGAPAAGERSPRSLVLTVMGMNISVILGLGLWLRCL